MTVSFAGLLAKAKPGQKKAGNNYDFSKGPFSTDIRTLVGSPLLDLCYSAKLVGSRQTVKPAPKGTDLDILLYVKDKRKFDRLTMKEEWLRCGSDIEDGGRDYPEPYFVSYRKGEVNLITTTRKDFYRKFLLASSLAKEFNLKEKRHRVALFQGILYGNQVYAF